MSRRMFRGNTVATTLASPVGTSDTTATLIDGSSYPDGSVGPFVVTVDAGAAGEEKWLVTSRTGNGLAGITRAYDGTSATSHNAGAAVKHTISAVDLDEANAHINVTSQDNHPQYALRAQGLAANIGAAGRAGKLYYKTDSDFLTLDDGAAFHDFQSKAVADAAYLLKAGGTADSLNVTGLTGSVAASRYVGATASGAPTTGAHLVGDWVIDQSGTQWICTVAGTPGTWVQSGSAAYVAKVGGSADSLAVTGLTGSVAASRYVGATASGAPTAGAHMLGDWVIDQTGKVWICTVAGTPGTWVATGGSSGGSGANPPFIGLVTPGSGALTQAAYPLSNCILYMAFRPQANITVTGVRFYVSAVGTVTMDVGIYSDNGKAPASRLVSTGPLAGTTYTAGAMNTATLSSTSLVGGTDYWLAITSNSGNSFSLLSIGAGATYADAVKQQSSTSTLPATATPVANAQTSIPLLYILG